MLIASNRSSRRTGLYLRLSTLMTLMLLSQPLRAQTLGDPLFEDGFETGAFRSGANGVSWASSRDTSVSDERSYSGRYALRFFFEGGPAGEDAFSEQRIRLPQRNEFWFRYRLYVPANYHHRRDGASNNKFLAVYRAPYTEPGFQVNFSLNPNDSGGSDLNVHYYHDGRELKPITLARDFITSADRGRWMLVVAQVRTPTSANASDGIMRMWKNNQLVAEITNLNSWGGSGENHITEAYLLGWANSGFNEDTVFFIDDFAVFDGEPQVVAKPRPPASLAVQ